MFEIIFCIFLESGVYTYLIKHNYQCNERYKGGLAMKTIWKKEKLPKKEVFLKKALLDAQRSREDAYVGLSNVKEPELIDSYIYELNAANLRYQVILRDYKLLENQKPSI